MELGKKLSSCRKKAGLSQEDLAEKIYVSRQTISNWEMTNPIRTFTV
ncbi:transcriptional regulator [Streptococcus uberis]|nr:transcriptional regulator [Streptococcus uberis]